MTATASPDVDVIVTGGAFVTDDHGGSPLARHGWHRAGDPATPFYVVYCPVRRVLYVHQETEARFVAWCETYPDLKPTSFPRDRISLLMPTEYER